MFELIALATICTAVAVAGASHLGMRRPTSAHAAPADPALWPYRHY